MAAKADEVQTASGPASAEPATTCFVLQTQQVIHTPPCTGGTLAVGQGRAVASSRQMSDIAVGGTDSPRLELSYRSVSTGPEPDHNQAQQHCVPKLPEYFASIINLEDGEVTTLQTPLAANRHPLSRLYR